MKPMNVDLHSVQKYLKYGRRLRPERDWLVLLGIFTFVLILSVVWNLAIFSRVTQGQQIGNETVSQPVQIKLDQVRTLFNQRADERQRYVGEYRFVDPSL